MTEINIVITIDKFNHRNIECSKKPHPKVETFLRYSRFGLRSENFLNEKIYLKTFKNGKRKINANAWEWCQIAFRTWFQVRKF